MPEVLSQAEIEALLAGLPVAGPQGGLAGDEAPSGQPRPTTTPRRDPAVREYSFRSPSKFSRDQLRALSMIHEDWGRRLGTSLGAQLRTPIHFNIAAVQQMAYHEFMELLTESIIYIFTAEAFDHAMLLEVNRGLGLFLFERLMGGSGGIRNLRRDLTEIERRVIDGVAERMLANLGEAWGSISSARVRPRIEQRETDPQFVTIVEPAETVVAILLEVKIGDETSSLNVCMPAISLDRIASELSAERWRRTRSKAPTEDMQDAIRSRIERTYADVSVVLGRATLTARELLGMREGDVIPLDTRFDDLLELRVEDRPKCWVRPGRLGRSLAVRVVDRIGEAAGEDD